MIFLPWQPNWWCVFLRDYFLLLLLTWRLANLTHSWRQPFQNFLGAMTSLVFRGKVLTLILDVIGTLTNLTALCHVVKTFDLKIHFFALIFIDALICTVCSVSAAVVTSASLIVGSDRAKFFYCTAGFLCHFLPGFVGACQTFLVASIRYFIALKSAKNQQPSNGRITLAALVFLGVLSLGIVIYVMFFAVQELPYAFTVEECLKSKDIRVVSGAHQVIHQSPNFFNILSLLVDVSLIRFLRKKIQPQVTPTPELIPTISGQITGGLNL